MEPNPAVEILFGIVLPLLVVIAAVLVFWALPVWMGVQWAKRKGYSPKWMLFGLHPVGGWIAALVMLNLPARAVCTHCRQWINDEYVVCPHCGRPRKSNSPFQSPGR